jgi:heat shock protein HspQ
MATDENVLAFPKFSVGQLIHHKRFDYRGVIYQVDATFQGTEEWYSQMAITGPPQNQAWYHVLVDEASHSTYVAERNLEEDLEGSPIDHPLIWEYFSKFEDCRYKIVIN